MRSAAFNGDLQYPMTIAEAILSIIGIDGDAVICAREPFSRDSEAVITRLTQDLTVPEDVRSKGYTYFLERELVVELLDMIDSKVASKEQRADFVCHYAGHDAYPAWFYALEDKTRCY